MSILKLQEYLLDHSVEQLTEDFGIKVKQDPTYSNLYNLDYSQTESPKGHEITDTCRGLLWDSDSSSPVAYAFDRFYNLGEHQAAPLDLHSSFFQEKMDGSLIILYYYNGWKVKTRGTTDANNKVGDFDLTFKDLFWNTFNEAGYGTQYLNTKYNYVFELCTPYNTVVVRHPVSKIYLLSVNDSTNYYQYTPEEYLQFNTGNVFTTPKVFKFGYDEALAYIAESNKEIVQSEGLIALSKNEGQSYSRVKIKDDLYVRLHHFTSGASEKGLFETALNGELSEVTVYFPELESKIIAYQEGIKSLELFYDALYLKLPQESQKEFALVAVKYKASGFLFQKKINKVKSFSHYLHIQKDSVNIGKALETYQKCLEDLQVCLN